MYNSRLSFYLDSYIMLNIIKKKKEELLHLVLFKLEHSRLILSLKFYLVSCAETL